MMRTETASVTRQLYQPNTDSMCAESVKRRRYDG
jgi:hypothetical protein